MVLEESCKRLPATWRLFEEGLEQRLHIGVQCYVSVGGAPVADFACGEAKAGVGMRTDTLMPWLSSGKPITGVAIAQLCERNRLSVHDRVAVIIPEFAQAGKESITIFHLLTHTAGFRSADKIPEDLPWDELIERICGAPGEWNPGEKAGYQIGSSWFILGEVIRRVDGRFPSQYMREEIFLPAGMNDCWLGIPREVVESYGDRVGVLYRTDRGEPEPHASWSSSEAVSACRPGSNVRGPIRDLGRFYERMLEALNGAGESLLKPETVRYMTQRHRKDLFDETFRHRLDWGLGLMVNSNRHGTETVPYSFGRFASEKAFGHGGAQSSSGFADPEHDLVVAWVCNGMAGEPRHNMRAREINSAIYADLGLR